MRSQRTGQGFESLQLHHVAAGFLSLAAAFFTKVTGAIIPPCYQPFSGMREFKSHRRIAKSIFLWLSLVGAMSALLRHSFFLRYKRTSSVRSLAPPFQAATAGAGLRLGFLNVNGDLFCLHNQNQPKPIF